MQAQSALMHSPSVFTICNYLCLQVSAQNFIHPEASCGPAYKRLFRAKHEYLHGYQSNPPKLYAIVLAICPLCMYQLLVMFGQFYILSVTQAPVLFRRTNQIDLDRILKLHQWYF
jgi:hypothetical protein